MNRRLFSVKMKLADIIAANRDIILMLPRFGIKLGFGDLSVRDICKMYNISEDLFLMVCNIYTFDDYQPDSEEMDAIEVSAMIKYLISSHRYYLNERIPHLERHLNNIAEVSGNRISPILKKYFSDYKVEVSEHFKHEEQFLFPHLSKLRDRGGLDREVFAKVGVAHVNLVDKLTDLTQIIYKYLPGDVLTEELMELVFCILQLSKDLEKHALIEDLILKPSENFVLSEREKDVLALVAKGLSSKEIADKLNISLHTVNSHRKNIVKKTNIKSVAGLTMYAALYATND